MFLVMSTHTRSHAASTVLWRVVSRPFNTRREAEWWRDFCLSQHQEEHPKSPHRFFVIETDFEGTLP